MSAVLLDPARFDASLDGHSVKLFTLRNARGMLACITNYGAKIVQLLVPDRHGQPDDVVLGYDSLDGVVSGSPSMGAFIGRYAGRIENSRFGLGGIEHRLSANNGPHCLHGGVRGSRFRVFGAEQPDASSVVMRYTFADGEEGFPGALALRLTYRLLESNELVLDYEALALDQPTVASFTTHAFFNLNGESSGSALGHEVMIAADQHLEMNADLVATGAIVSVTDTPFDFRQATLLNQRLRGLPANAQTEGYDCCYLVNRAGPADTVAGMALCARVSAPESGRVMEVWSSEPALQFYTGLQAQTPLPGGPGKSGQTYFQQQGLCFEPQGYPNAPNCPVFPSALYQPGQSRAGRTAYRFSNT